MKQTHASDPVARMISRERRWKNRLPAPRAPDHEDEISVEEGLSISFVPRRTSTTE